MKPGLKLGISNELKITVDKTMLAGFGGELIHPVYSTFCLVHHMEWVARLNIVSFFEDDEEGVGSRVEVQHENPALEGMQIVLCSKIVDIQNNKTIRSQIEVFSPIERIASGYVEQTVIKKAWLQKKVESLQAKLKV